MCRTRETVYWGRQKIYNRLRKYSSRDQRVQQQNSKQNLSNNYLFEWIVPKGMKKKHSGTSPSHLVQSPNSPCPRPYGWKSFCAIVTKLPSTVESHRSIFIMNTATCGKQLIILGEVIQLCCDGSDLFWLKRQSRGAMCMIKVALCLSSVGGDSGAVTKIDFKILYPR